MLNISELSHEAAPRYDYGNGANLQLREVAWNQETGEIDSQSAFVPVIDGRHYPEGVLPPGTPEWQAAYREKLAEIREGWQIVTDPDPGSNSTLEMTVVNADTFTNDNGAIVRVSDKSVPEDPLEAIELAEDALMNPDRPIIHVVVPGRGGSTGLSREEFELARRDGSLVSKFKTPHAENGSDVVSYDPFPSIKSMARILGRTRGKITHMTSSGLGAHYGSALMAALPERHLERAVLYSPTNISDLYGALPLALKRGYSFHQRYGVRLKADRADASEYAYASKDALAITPERIAEAQDVLGADFAVYAARQRAAVIGKTPKIHSQSQIYTKGMDRGESAISHMAAGLQNNPSAKSTYIFPEFAPHYYDPLDISRFLDEVYRRGREASGAMNVRGYVLPVGRPWRRYHPLARLALQDKAFKG